MLTKKHRQEALSRAYVQAIAARCGLNHSLPTLDYGIDLTLHDISVLGNRRCDSGYKLDVQAKSTTLASVEERHIRYDMEVKAYEDLRQPVVGCPRILVLLVLPEQEARWLTQTEEELIFRHCAYWLSLKGREPTTNRKSVRILIPRANVFSVGALRVIMDRVKRRVEL